MFNIRWQLTKYNDQIIEIDKCLDIFIHFKLYIHLFWPEGRYRQIVLIISKN